tara:strand:+ start:169462 stop:170559 length:1098 start_codon:yes stop_codon:yes gene_type:complete
MWLNTLKLYNQYNNKGFTIVDVILIMSVLAILVTLSYPAATDFLMLKKESEERGVQHEILGVVNAYAEKENELPIGNSIANFAAAVSATSHLTVSETIVDIFGNQRYYKTVVEQEVFRDAVLDIYYTIIYSTGVDGCWDSGVAAECTAADIASNFDALLNDAGANTFQSTFNQITVPEGDFLIKYTDYERKIKQYEITVKRLNKLSDALAEYGTLNYYEGLAEGLSSTLIYYPASDVANLNLFYSEARSDTSAETNATDIYGASGSDVILNDDDAVNMAVKEERRLGMIALTRILGLPDEYCCNALKRFTMGGKQYEEGFFYYANPKARIDPLAAPPNNCGPLATTVAERKLPPRISVEEDPCGK